MTPEIEAQLAGLRDIRLPEPIGWWPLAPGWWAVLTLIGAAVLAVLLWRSLRKRTARYLALRELERIDASDPVQFATTLSVLLRRVARCADPATGTLKGAGWSAFLSEGGMEPALAAHLAEAPYADHFPQAPAPDALRRAVATWIRRQA
ncbi:MAG: hypothetical protein CR964_00185 [Rhodobacterales bacterium]|nr:MAG: hypothetical protein CR964_00185 [Rhodobacterales bacterium]